MAREAGGYLSQREFDAVCPAVSSTAFCVYAALVTCRNAQTGETPVVGTPLLMRKTGRGRTQVFEAIGELRKGGFLLSERHGKGNVYRFPQVF